LVSQDGQNSNGPNYRQTWACAKAQKEADETSIFQVAQKRLSAKRKKNTSATTNKITQEFESFGCGDSIECFKATWGLRQGATLPMLSIFATWSLHESNQSRLPVIFLRLPSA
jgi:hypothetical protein